MREHFLVPIVGALGVALGALLFNGNGHNAAVSTGQHPVVAIQVCDAAKQVIKAAGETSQTYNAHATVEKTYYVLTWQVAGGIGSPVAVERPYYVGIGPVIWAEQIDQAFVDCAASKPTETKIIPSAH